MKDILDKLPCLSENFLNGCNLKNRNLVCNIFEGLREWLKDQPSLAPENITHCEQYLRKLISLITKLDETLDNHLRTWNINLLERAEQLSLKKNTSVIKQLIKDVIQAWNQEIFPALSEEWFREHGVKDPKISAEEFQNWIKEKGISLRPYNSVDHNTYIVEVCRVATGLSKTTIRQYFAGQDADENWNRQFKISTLRALNHLLEQLQLEHSQCPQISPNWDKTTLTTRGLSTKRVTILTEFEPSVIPSLLFHSRMISGILKSDAKHLFSTSIHIVSNVNFEKSLAQVIRVNSTDALILVRPIGLSQKIIERLKRNLIPTVLVHANRRKNFYSSPSIIANFVPDQRNLSNDLKNWIVKHHNLKDLNKVIIVSIPKEKTPGSIRDDRLEKFYKALEQLGLNYKHIFLTNYSFENAFEVFKQEPEANLYITLSEQIGATLKYLLIAKGRYKPKSIIGFDNSQIAQKANLNTFEQNIELIGEKISDLISDFFSKESIEPTDWPAFREIKVPVTLVDRENIQVLPNI